MSLIKQQSEIRRKYSPVDLQQVVVKIDVYNRPINCSNGKSGAAFGICHEAGVATTENGKVYMIEKGVSRNDDINFQIRYREGECRIVEVVQKDVRDWKLVSSVKCKCVLTLEDLFDKCGSDYSWWGDNCWNSTQRMRVAADESESGLTWQEKGAIGVGAVALGAIAFGILGAVLSKEEKKKEPQKY